MGKMGLGRWVMALAEFQETSVEQEEMRTAFKVVSYLGSAHTGVVFWLLQRISALIIGIFSIWGILELFKGKFATYETFSAWMYSPWNKAGFLFLIFAVAIHNTLGFQVIVEDYIRSLYLKMVCIFLMRIISIGLFLICLVCLLKI